MRGSLKQRSKGSWSLILDLGRETDAAGTSKRRQKWITFRGTRKQAETKLTELLGAADGGTFVEPSKVTLIDWLRTWLEKSVKPPMRRPGTYRVYGSMIETHVAASTLALVPLQKLRGSDIERFYADLTLAPSSVTVLHAVIHRALRKAVKDKLLTVNPAVDLERRRPTASAAAREHCWSATEARRVLTEVATSTPQLAAFVYLALDSGARKSEIDGLTWADIDLDTATLTVARQLDEAGREPVWGPTKTKRVRTLTLTGETVAALRTHRQAQRQLKMKNRATYVDYGLIFAKEDVDLQTPAARLGEPLTTLSDHRFQHLVKAAGVRRIKFHGVRHTVATLSLQAGVPPHVVAVRLGHSVMELMKTYAHALPGMQQDAAARLGAALHG